MTIDMTGVAAVIFTWLFWRQTGFINNLLLMVAVYFMTVRVIWILGNWSFRK